MYIFYRREILNNLLLAKYLVSISSFWGEKCIPNFILSTKNLPNFIDDAFGRKKMSIICQRVTQLIVWDSSYLLWFFHTYLKHLLLKFLWMDQLSVSGSNICEWIRFFLSHFLHCYVYRQANLCSGLRSNLRPQLIKKELAF